MTSTSFRAEPLFRGDMACAVRRLTRSDPAAETVSRPVRSGPGRQAYNAAAGVVKR
ncbi:hypothetical protein ACFYQ5_26780 [Streptomyces sp. NPDC005794]|uniref:hypothetical protein n=1 Tax=Streptomyces sp. NPDC005794 TaxID=3364733 RepID=UPI00367B61FE